MEAGATRLGEDELEIKSADGSKVLIAQTARHVMVHIANTLERNEGELL